MRTRINSAHVLALIAIILALGGNAVAFTLGKNSVGSKQLKKNSVTTAKIRKEAVTAGKVKKGTLTGTQIKASTLGTMPSAQAAQTAQTANALSPPEAWHEVGAPGEPKFLGSWVNSGEGTSENVAFFKDHDGIVHLKGEATGGSGENLFALPPGFRPANQKRAGFQVGCSGTITCSDGTGEVVITGSGVGAGDGFVSVPPGATTFKLDGITFRAES